MTHLRAFHNGMTHLVREELRNFDRILLWCGPVVLTNKATIHDEDDAIESMCPECARMDQEARTLSQRETTPLL